MCHCNAADYWNEIFMAQQQIRYKSSLKASCSWMSVILCNMLAHWLNWLFFMTELYTVFFLFVFHIHSCVYANRIAWSGWMIYLLIVILGLICNYVRGIGLFPITGYCSNTTSCTENHCELKSNKVCHCYRGKLFFFFFFFPSAYPNFSWHAASVN